MNTNNYDENDLTQALQKMRVVCKVIRLGFLAATLIYLVFWLLVAVGSVVAYLGLGQSLPGELVYTVTGGLFAVLILWHLSQIFNEVVKGNPPFSEAQADRLRTIAIIAMSYVVLDLLISIGFVFEPMPELGFAVVANDGNIEPTINLNIGMLVFSAIMYSLSAIFRYAALLQQLSDETV